MIYLHKQGSYISNVFYNAAYRKINVIARDMVNIFNR